MTITHHLLTSTTTTTTTSTPKTSLIEDSSEVTSSTALMLPTSGSPGCVIDDRFYSDGMQVTNLIVTILCTEIFSQAKLGKNTFTSQLLQVKISVYVANWLKLKTSTIL